MVTKMSKPTSYKRPKFKTMKTKKAPTKSKWMAERADRKMSEKYPKY